MSGLTLITNLENPRTHRDSVIFIGGLHRVKDGKWQTLDATYHLSRTSAKKMPQFGK